VILLRGAARHLAIDQFQSGLAGLPQVSGISAMALPWFDLSPRLLTKKPGAGPAN